jgi:hypothetical protein
MVGASLVALSCDWFCGHLKSLLQLQRMTSEYDYGWEEHRDFKIDGRGLFQNPAGKTQNNHSKSVGATGKLVEI